MIKTVEIICQPCYKCERLEERIRTIIDCIAFKNRIRIKYDFKFNKNISDIAKYGYKLNQKPMVLINSHVAFAGHIKEDYIIRTRLEDIMEEF